MFISIVFMQEQKSYLCGFRKTAIPAKAGIFFRLAGIPGACGTISRVEYLPLQE